MGKLWGGRFKKSLDDSAMKLSYSFHFDKQLLPYDIQTNSAHVKALCKAGLFTEEERDLVLNCLSQLDYDSVIESSETFPDEDVHSYVERWVTEKLGDCYTSHTFPFYYGAPNVDAYYNPMSYELIDITDFDGTLKRIQQILNNEKHYEKHLQYLIEAKCDYLNKHSMLPMICNVINKNIKIKEATEDNLNELTIYPYKIGLFQKTINKFIRHAKRLLNA